jgi:aminopeptidase
MIDPDALARLLCDWCVEARERDQVIVGITPQAMALAAAIHRTLLHRGAWPLMRFGTSVFAEQFYTHARELQLDSFAPLELAEAEQADASIGIEAPANTRALAGIDPGLITRAARARAPLQEARLASRWCVTQWPTPALAQQAGMSEADYSAFLERALFLDRADPLEAWRALSTRQQQLVDELTAVQEIHIEADGTDLRVGVAGRTWVNSDGRHNMPSGEIFTGPIEDSANGTIRYTVPSSPRGAHVEDIELTFSRGEVVKARAARGDHYLQAALRTDRGARFLGELGIGTNRGVDRPTGSILLDEKMAGTVHLALGRSYPQTGGRNASALHWDMICDLRDGGRLSADGVVFNAKLWESG